MLIGIHVLTCVFLVAIILVQPGKGDAGIGFGGGGSSQSIFGSKGAGNFLTKMTTGAAFVFILTSFILTYQRVKYQSGSVISPSATATTPVAEPKSAEAQAEATLEGAIKGAKDDEAKAAEGGEK